MKFFVIGFLGFLFLFSGSMVWINWRLWWCQWKHRKHHVLKPTFYGSGYSTECSKCNQVFFGYRN